jgi:hypothetical protein
MINRYVKKNKDEQQTNLLQEQNNQTEAPIRNEDYEV